MRLNLRTEHFNLAATVLASTIIVGLSIGSAVYPTEPPAATFRPSGSALTAPVRILTLGDSRSSSGQWQAELSHLLDAAGVPHVISNPAVAGTSCSYWPPQIKGLVNAFQPDLVVLACGTNDNPATMTHGESATSWAFRSVVEAVHAYRPRNPARTLATLVQYSDPILAPGWLLSNEPKTNDNLYSQMHYYLPPRTRPGWLAGIADLQAIPATATYLAAEPYPGTPSGQIGIHPTAHGYWYMGRIIYDAARAVMGWPPATEPPLCDLYGHRQSYPRPAYTPC